MSVDELNSSNHVESGPVVNGPIDIIMLTHNRLEHLVATVDALEERTPEPYRLTIVDNASGPDVRNWLAENQHRFERVIFNPSNDHVPAFNLGIAASLSDPFVLADPDVIVPDIQPSWLARMLDLVERYPDFGLIGVGCDLSNRPQPPILAPENIEPHLVNDELVETNVGTIFQFIRRDALLTPYKSDGQACDAVRRAGYRVGWSPLIRGLHLGWDDFRLFPGHLLSKREGGVGYPESYGEVDLVKRPPSIGELALAAPVIAETRRLGIPDAAVLELAWDGPVLGPAVPDVLSIEPPAGAKLPLEDASAGAVVLKLPPAERATALLAEACRSSARLVVALAPLSAFGGKAAADVAPEGWTGREALATADLPLQLARAVEIDPSLAKKLEGSIADDRERWLDLFAHGNFGPGELRLWIWERKLPLAAVDRVSYDPARVTPWRSESLSRPEIKRLSLAARFWKRADLAERVAVWQGRIRRSRSRR